MFRGGKSREFDQILRSAVDLNLQGLEHYHRVELMQQVYAAARFYKGILIHDSKIPDEDRGIYLNLNYLGQWRAGILKDKFDFSKISDYMDKENKFEKLLRGAVDLTSSRDNGTLSEDDYLERMSQLYSAARFYGGVLVRDDKIPYQDRGAYVNLEYLGRWRAGELTEKFDFSLIPDPPPWPLSMNIYKKSRGNY